jgi:uncharacterized protein YmfQ (DUF2313 family)
VDKFWQALAFLLPSGFAWPRDPNSTLMRVMRAFALALNDLHDFTRLTANQWQPHQTITRLAEWEAATGLPDACFGADQSETLRRKLLLSRLRGPTLTYKDTSPAASGVLVAICAALGYSATVAYNTPFRCGMVVGQPLGALDGQLYVTVVVQSSAFRVGLSNVGDRLLAGRVLFRVSRSRINMRLVESPPDGPLYGGELACYLQRVVPARYRVNVNFVLS